MKSEIPQEAAPLCRALSPLRGHRGGELRTPGIGCRQPKTKPQPTDSKTAIALLLIFPSPAAAPEPEVPGRSTGGFSEGVPALLFLAGTRRLFLPAAKAAGSPGRTGEHLLWLPLQGSAASHAVTGCVTPSCSEQQPPEHRASPEPMLSLPVLL